MIMQPLFLLHFELVRMKTRLLFRAPALLLFGRDRRIPGIGLYTATSESRILSKEKLSIQ